MKIQNLQIDLPVYVIMLLAVLAIWELAWKSVAMWSAARNNKLAWFLCIAIFNTAGILPITYLLLHRKSNKV